MALSMLGDSRGTRRKTSPSEMVTNSITPVNSPKDLSVCHLSSRIVLSMALRAGAVGREGKNEFIPCHRQDRALFPTPGRCHRHNCCIALSGWALWKARAPLLLLPPERL